MLSLGEKSATDTLFAERGDDGQVVDVEKRASLERGKTKEADRNAHGLLSGKREQHQGTRMTL